MVDDLDLRDSIRYAGLEHELYAAFIHALLDAGGDMHHVRQFIKHRSSADKMMRTLIDELPEVKYRPLWVATTGMLPAFTRLNGSLFARAGDEFSNSHVWRVCRSNENADLSPGDRLMLLKHFNRRMSEDEVMLWAEENGYRVATHTEAVDFARAYPELQNECVIAALGSFTMVGTRRAVAVLTNQDGGRQLLAFSPARGWWGYPVRFLLVKKK